MTVDPTDLEVMRGRLESLAQEMQIILLRSSYSTILTESLDATSALFDSQGRTMAQAVSIPIHLGVLAELGRRVAERFPAGTARPDDLYAINDPYAGGTHLPDIAVFAPAFSGERLVGYVATMSHHADVGGSAPGSCTRTICATCALSAWPTPTTVFLILLGAYSPTGSPNCAGTNIAMPRA